MLRSNPGFGELEAWKVLRQFRAEGFTFRRQQRIGPYVADFVCLRRKLIVEIDGGIHEKFDNPQRDVERDAWLTSEGYRVLRFKSDQLSGGSWLLDVRAALKAQPESAYRSKQSAPSPGGGRGRGESQAPSQASMSKDQSTDEASSPAKDAASPLPLPPPPLGEGEEPFWKRKSLKEMSEAEWESLCDGCGKCCLVGLEDEDTGEIYLTDLACKLFDTEKCACGDYANRFEKIDDCTKLTPDNVPELHWLPKTCAYRLVAAGRDLYWWHHLVSGDRETVHAANVSVRGKTNPERGQKVRTLMRRIVEWPQPKRAPRKRKTPSE